MFDGFSAHFDLKENTYSVSYRGRYLGHFSGACAAHAVHRALSLSAVHRERRKIDKMIASGITAA